MNFNSPAFAASGVHEPGAGVYVQQDGMSIRAYFAARAPSIIPAWFEPVMPPEPQSPPEHPDLSGIPEFEGPPDDMAALSRRNYIYNIANGWSRDSCYSLADIMPSSARTDDNLRALLELGRPALSQFEDNWNGYREELAEWRREREIARVAQWPWAWADLVLSAESVQR